jgi:hypothetical protein
MMVLYEREVFNFHTKDARNHEIVKDERKYHDGKDDVR